MTNRRVTNYEILESIQEVKEGQKEIKKLLYGTDGNPGLIHRVRNCENFVGGAKKLMWTAVTAALVSVVGLIVALVQ